MTAQWHVEGPDVAGAATLDAVFQSVMQAQNIRAASVAIASGRTIYAKRAYTWAEPGNPVTTPTTTFRLASVSKLFTAAAIQRLADQHLIDLNASVFGYLGLRDTNPHDTDKDAITIAQCATSKSGMPHDYEKDGMKLRDVSLALGHHASIAEQAEHMYFVTPLTFTPGNPPPGDGKTDTGYSNTAFDVLAAVIEKATGMRYADYLAREVAGAMGLRDVAGARTARGDRLPGEVDGYDSPGTLLPSQLDLALTATETDVYGGDFFLEPRPASGGVLASPSSVARFLDRHNVYGLGGRMGGTRYGTFIGTSAGATSTNLPTGQWDFAWATNREIDNSIKNQITDAITSYLTAFGASLIGHPFDVDEGFAIRGVLLLGGFRTQHELNAMSYEDMRNTLIVEMSKHSNQPVGWYQGQDDATLGGMGAAMVYLRHTGSRDDAALRQMSADDQRNTLIVEMDAQTGQGRALQGLSTLDLVLIALGSDVAIRGQVPGMVSSWIRGVLLVGRFRTQQELNTMSHDDMRNTLIVEMTKHSNQSTESYQALNDAQLEGVGAVMVLMRHARIRDDGALRQMSADDQRNTLIVELDAQTHLGRELQGLSNLGLARTAIGDRPGMHSGA